jgi:hypothetical protein
VQFPLVPQRPQRSPEKEHVIFFILQEENDRLLHPRMLCHSVITVAAFASSAQMGSSPHIFENFA